MNIRTSILFLVVVIFLSSGCQAKSSTDYLKEAHAARAANDPVGAERLLQEGLKSDPENTNLATQLASLYEATRQWDKLEGFLMLHPFANDWYYWPAVALEAYERQEWSRSYDAWLHAGDGAQLALPDVCAVPDVARPYHDAGVVGMKMNSRPNVERALRKLNALLSKCTGVERAEVLDLIADLTS